MLTEQQHTLTFNLNGPLVTLDVTGCTKCFIHPSVHVCVRA